MRHKQSTIEYAQGWLSNQLERSVEEQITEESQVAGQQILTMWKKIDEALDDLFAERKEMLDKLDTIQRIL